MKVARISTPLVSKIIICSIFAFSLGLGAFPFWTADVILQNDNTKFCGSTNEYLYGLWSMLVLRIGSLYLPFANIFIFTGLILIFLRRTRKQRAQFQDEQASSSSHKIDLQLTIMLIGVAMAFLLLRLPYTLSYVINWHKYTLWEPLEPRLSYRIYLINKICDMFSTTNYALNFFLYCLCGNAFRKRLKALLRCTSANDRKASDAAINRLKERCADRLCC